MPSLKSNAKKPFSPAPRSIKTCANKYDCEKACAPSSQEHAYYKKLAKEAMVWCCLAWFFCLLSTNLLMILMYRPATSQIGWKGIGTNTSNLETVQQVSTLRGRLDATFPGVLDMPLSEATVDVVATSIDAYNLIEGVFTAVAWVEPSFVQDLSCDIPTGPAGVGSEEHYIAGPPCEPVAKSNIVHISLDYEKERNELQLMMTSTTKRSGKVMHDGFRSKLSEPRYFELSVDEVHRLQSVMNEASITVLKHHSDSGTGVYGTINMLRATQCLLSARQLVEAIIFQVGVSFSTPNAPCRGNIAKSDPQHLSEKAIRVTGCINTLREEFLCYDHAQPGSLHIAHHDELYKNGVGNQGFGGNPPSLLPEHQRRALCLRLADLREWVVARVDEGSVGTSA